MKKKYIMPKATTITFNPVDHILAGSNFNARITNTGETNEYAKGYVEDDWED